MREVVVLTFASLDGVMQALGGKGEDPSGGFDREVKAARWPSAAGTWKQ
jgi:hypothetical protein